MSAETPTGETPCIRRWYATYTSCTCPPCRRATQTYVKRRQAGVSVRVPASAAWAVLDGMMERDWSHTAIASACNLAVGTVAGMFYQRATDPDRTITAGVSARIVNHGRPTRGSVGATGARRKLQALACLGHSLQQIADVADVPVSTLAPIRRGDTDRIRPQIADQIDDVWRAMCMTRGSSARTRNQAQQERWAPPLAWNRIDDPSDRPTGAEGGATRQSRRAEALRLIGAGASLANAAAEAGISVRTAARALTQAPADEFSEVAA